MTQDEWKSLDDAVEHLKEKLNTIQQALEVIVNNELDKVKSVSDTIKARKENGKKRRIEVDRSTQSR